MTAKIDLNMLMRNKTFFSLLAALAALAGVGAAQAQSPVITSFGRNGVLVSSNLLPGSAVGVEWAPAATGPWQSDWSSLSRIIAPTNRKVTVSVPMFYRVRGVTNGGFTTDGMALVLAGSFTIGDTMDGDLLDNARPTNVYVSAFFMDTNLVSGSKWVTVSNYAVTHGHVFISLDFNGFARGPNFPVQNSRWLDVVKWCNARSKQAGLAPVYYANAGLTQVYTN